MAVGFELGPAFVQLIPSMRGAEKAVERELASINVSGATSRWGSTITSALGGAFQTAAKVGVTSIAAVGASIAGLAIKGGIERALSIENAEAKLTGLGHSAESVSAIMGNALTSVKGTAYGLGDAATVAAGLVASGVQSGAELEGVLKTVADTAQISGKSMTDVGAIFGSVAARGKLQGDDLLQLTSAGVPALQFLSEQLGVTSAEVSEMVSKGQVDFATFATAMQNGLGGAALAAGETFQGAWANVQAALSRSGAALMTPILEGLRVVFVALAPVIDQATAALQPFAEWLGEKVGAAAQYVAEWLGTVDFSTMGADLQASLGGIDLESITAAFQNFGQTVSGVWSILVNGDFTGLPGFSEDSQVVDSLFRIREAFMGLGEAMPEVGESLATLSTTGFSVLASTLTFVADNIDTIIAWLPAVAAGFLLWRGATTGVTAANRALTAAQLMALPVQLANNSMRLQAARAELAAAVATRGSTAAENTSMLTRLRATGAMVAQRMATVATSAATKAAAAAQWAMNAAMSANPIMLVVLAIAALVAGLVWFFTQTELGKEIWANVTQFFVDSWNNVVSFFSTAWDSIVAFFVTALDWILDLFFTWHPLGIIISNWDAIVAWFGGFWDGLVAGVQAALDWVIDLFMTWHPLGAIISNWDAITAWFAGFWSGLVQGFTLALESVGAVFTWLHQNIVAPVFDAIGAAFTWLYENTVLAVTTAMSLAIQGFGAVVDWLNTNVVQPVFSAIGATFLWLYQNVVLPVWSGIQNAIQVVANWITNTLWPGIQMTLGYMAAGFELLKTTITTVWENIKTAAMTPVKFIVESVYRDGIKATFDKVAEAVGIDTRLPPAPPLAFASGGVLGGHSPGRDIYDFISPNGGGHLRLGGGESIMVTEFADYFGRGGVATLNSLAKRGQLGQLFGGTQAFADGGIWDAVGATFKGAGDWLGSVVDSVAQIVADPAAAIDKLIREPVKSLLSSLGGGTFGDMFTNVPLTMVDKISDWFKTLIAPTTQGANGDWVGGNTLERLRPLIAATGTIITDTYRDPAYNAAVGGSPTSYHMDRANPAVDVAGSNAAMWAFYDLVMANGPWRQVIWQSAGHYDHVHVANRGGIVGELPTTLYDSGGWLQPGISLVQNATGKPEAVYTQSQWSTLEKSLGQGRWPETVRLVISDEQEFDAYVDRRAAGVTIRALEEVRS